MKRQYKNFSNIVVDGDVKYCAGVEQCSTASRRRRTD